MVSPITNKLLATVITVAVSGALTAHAAQGARVTLPSLGELTPHMLPASPSSTHSTPGHSTTTAPSHTQTGAAQNGNGNHQSGTNQAGNNQNGTNQTGNGQKGNTPSLSAQAASIRQAAQRDHDALEQLRVKGASLKGAAKIHFIEQIASDEAQVLALENAALASLSAGHSVDVKATVGRMDSLVAQAQALLTQAAKEAGATGQSGD